MKKLLLSLFIIFGFFASAQNQNDLGKIQLAISFSENQQNTTDFSILEKLEGKLTQLLSNSGIVSTSYNNGLLLQPSLVTIGNDVVESGMQNLNVTRILLQLLIKQDQTNIIFSSFSKELKGTGRTKELAINSAINSLKSNDPALLNFVENGKIKLQDYYQSNCMKILNNANNLQKTSRYEESLALLMSVPETASCYQSAQKSSLEVYKNYQKKLCAENIKQANMLIAERDYSSAFNALSDIGVDSPCAVQSAAIIKSIDSEISALEKKQWDMEMKIYNDAVALEKQRINAIKDIAVSFYKSQKRPNQIIIVK